MQVLHTALYTFLMVPTFVSYNQGLLEFTIISFFVTTLMFDSGLTPLRKTTSLSLLKSVSRAKAWGKVKNEEKASFSCYRFAAEQKIAKSSDATTYTL